jgi:transcriptional regulator with XRE-family HTH domain
MSKINAAIQSPPFEVESALKLWGARLRTARLARNLSMEQAAAKLGVGRRVVAAIEAGSPGTAVGAYLGLMWLYGLAPQLRELADPARDELVLRSASQRVRAYPRTGAALDNDF